MPWTGNTFAKHNHSLNKAGNAKAASIATAVLKSSGDEGEAIAVANKYANKHAGKLKKRGIMSQNAAEKRGM